MNWYNKKMAKVSPFFYCTVFIKKFGEPENIPIFDFENYPILNTLFSSILQIPLKFYRFSTILMNIPVPVFP